MSPEVPIAPSDTGPVAEPDDASSAGTRSNQLASHLQASIEVERSQLTRQLHDDLGGLLVGALMDVAWVEARLQSPELQAKLGRARDSLRAAVDLKRNLIEGMRPTLLENVGVFAAMRWHFAKYREDGALQCNANFPATEPALKPHVAIGIYRITEEALRLISGPLRGRSITLGAKVSGSSLQVNFSHDGVALAELELVELPEFKSMSQRVSTLHGMFTMSHGEPEVRWQFVVPIEPQGAEPFAGR